MPYLFALFILCSSVLFLIGLVSPNIALFWTKKDISRKKSALIHGTVFLLSFIGLSLTVPNIEAEQEEKVIVEPLPSKSNPIKESQPRSTSFAKRHSSNLPEIQDTGWIVPDEYQPWFKDGGLNRDKWVIPTYDIRQPLNYTEDKSRSIALYQKVIIHASYEESTKKREVGYFIVSPVGSAERYCVGIHGITRKDPNRCSLAEKISNGMTVKAQYHLPSDPGNRPLDGGGNDEFNFISIPAKAIILPLTYSADEQRFFCYYYDRKGKELGSANFHESTLVEADLP